MWYERKYSKWFDKARTSYLAPNFTSKLHFLKNYNNYNNYRCDTEHRNYVTNCLFRMRWILNCGKYKWNEYMISQLYCNLSNSEISPKKISGPQRDSIPWPLRSRCSALPSELWRPIQLPKLRYNCEGHVFIPFVFSQFKIHLILCFISFTGWWSE